MVTFGALRDARLSDVAEAAEEWTRLGRALRQVHENVVRYQHDLFERWKGEDAEAAAAQFQMFREKTYSAHHVTNGVGAVLAAGHHKFIQAQTALLDAIEKAHALRIRVGEDGSLTLPPPEGPADHADLAVMQRHATAVRERMEAALKKAQEADREVTEALGKLGPDILELGGADDDAKQVAYRAIWMVNPHEVDGRPSLAGILQSYQVKEDPRGMTEYPDGFLGWAAKKFFGQEPREVTVAEEELLGELRAKYDVRGLLQFLEDQESASESTPGDGEQDGRGDAWRHAYWNAILTRDFGEEWTERFAIAHEMRGDNPGPREAMDLHNNEVGRQIAQQHPHATNEEMKRYIHQAVEDGRMVVIAADGHLAWSDARDPESGRKIATMPKELVEGRLPDYGSGKDPSDLRN